METTDKLAFSLQVLRRYSVPDTYLRDFNANLQSLTVGEVNEALRKHIHPDTLKIIVYADQSKVQADLSKIGVVSLQ